MPTHIYIHCLVATSAGCGRYYSCQGGREDKRYEERRLHGKAVRDGGWVKNKDGTSTQETRCGTNSELSWGSGQFITWALCQEVTMMFFSKPDKVLFLPKPNQLKVYEESLVLMLRSHFVTSDSSIRLKESSLIQHFGQY